MSRRLPSFPDQIYGDVVFIRATEFKDQLIPNPLKRWKKTSSDRCKLCQNCQTTNHILNPCPESLKSGRYTWRHNCIVNYIVTSVDSKYTVYCDMADHMAPGGGTIPPELCVTTQKPDIVILNNHMKTMHIFELTCPSENYIETRHTDKSNKYSHFETDITDYLFFQGIYNTTHP